VRTFHRPDTTISPAPDDDLGNLNYDVGALAQFPQSHSTPGGFTIEVITHDFQLNRLPGIDVTLRNPSVGNSWVDIYQGQSSDVLPGGTEGGGIYVLGAESGAMIQASSQYTMMGSPSPSLSASSSFNWLVGEAIVNGPNDTVQLTLTPIEGSYPLVVRPELHGDTTSMILTFETAFDSLPTLELSGGTQSYSFQPVGNSYTTQITDSLGSGGTMTIWAKDAAAVPYFFKVPYVTYHSPSGLTGHLTSAGGQCELVLDTTVAAPLSALILSSYYPVLSQVGLSMAAVRVGAAYGVSLGSGTTGNHHLILRYDQQDLQVGVNQQANEAGLIAMIWEETLSAWMAMKSTVDTLHNEVETEIPGDGVYALFSSGIITGIDDEISGDNLPGQLRLSQNYPNPFNPTTTIQYSLPRRLPVMIEVYNILGRRVRTLENKTLAAGTYTVSWDGTDEHGHPVSTGVYLYRLQTGDKVETRKMLLLK